MQITNLLKLYSCSFNRWYAWNDL